MSPPPFGRHSVPYTVRWVKTAKRQLNTDIPSHLRAEMVNFVEGPLRSDPNGVGVRLLAHYTQNQSVKCCKRQCRIVYEVNDELNEVLIKSVAMLK